MPSKAENCGQGDESTRPYHHRRDMCPLDRVEMKVSDEPDVCSACNAETTGFDYHRQSFAVAPLLPETMSAQTPGASAVDLSPDRLEACCGYQTSEDDPCASLAALARVSSARARAPGAREGAHLANNDNVIGLRDLKRDLKASSTAPRYFVPSVPLLCNKVVSTCDDMPDLAAPCEGTVRVLIIDHYDSYTNNILQLLQGVKDDGEGHRYPEWKAVIVRYDQFSWDQFQTDVLPHFDAIILSPGPGRSDRTKDFGCNADLLRTVNVPVLGICLGHQGIATAFGGHLIEAPDIIHGQVSEVSHNGKGVLRGLPQLFAATRYNSLLVDERTIPSELELTAWTYDPESPSTRIILGLQHRSRPLFGTQWHPESICSTHGREVLRNFRDIVFDYWKTSGSHNNWTGRPLSKNATIPSSLVRSGAILGDDLSGNSPAQAIISKEHSSPAYRVKSVSLGTGPEARDVFEKLVLRRSLDGEVWLDSAKSRDCHSRNSYMASAAAGLYYRTTTRTLEVVQDQQLKLALHLETSFWDWLDYFQSSLIQGNTAALPAESLGQVAEVGQPLLQVGLIGSLGYELKSESLPGYSPSQPRSEQCRDSQLLFADRVLRLDHFTGEWNAFGLVRVGDDDPIGDFLQLTRRIGLAEMEFDDWIARLRARLSHDLSESRLSPASLPTFVSQDNLASYSRNVGAAKEAIRQGESYELTLTTRFEADHPTEEDPYRLYLSLRANNPAPYSAYLHFPYSDTVILSSSPERFLSIDINKITEMKPIKGTVAVSPDPAEDERRRLRLAADRKELAENLMIVDLIRSDLHNICQSESITVEKLMHVESYETVHQLVTTIQGRVVPAIGSVKVVERCFPPGSMTGAPKLRSVQILEELEQHRDRGMYSGSVGYICASGTVDQSVVIRTICKHRERLVLGAGGAITWLSDPASEWAEVMTKANAVTKSLPGPDSSVIEQSPPDMLSATRSANTSDYDLHDRVEPMSSPPLTSPRSRKRRASEGPSYFGHRADNAALIAVK